MSKFIKIYRYFSNSQHFVLFRKKLVKSKSEINMVRAVHIGKYGPCGPY